jgi:hypothetical protein
VLVVDDEPQIRLPVEMQIERADNGLPSSAARPADTRGYACGSNCDPTLVVFDLSMPDLHGLEVAQRIHASDPEQAIVLFSSHEDGPMPLTSLLGLVCRSSHRLSDRDAATLGMPAGTTISAAAAELVLAMNDPGAAALPLASGCSTTCRPARARVRGCNRTTVAPGGLLSRRG